MSTDAEFRRLVEALAPWNQQLVFVGGWAHRMYRLHPDAGQMTYEPLTTRDADVAFGDRQRLDGSILKHLKEAGFKEELTGEHKPPVSRYTLGAEGDQGFYAEFLTPLIGRERDKAGNANATLAKADITAQKLRYLDVLLMSPWEVLLPAVDGSSASMLVRIPNPVRFVVQKFLIHEGREPEKQAQDLLYVHDTLEIFASQLTHLAAIWREDVEPSLQRSGWIRSFMTTKERLLGQVGAALRDAAAIRPDRQLDPERMRRLCIAAFYEIISEPSGLEAIQPGGKRASEPAAVAESEAKPAQNI